MIDNKKEFIRETVAKFGPAIAFEVMTDLGMKQFKGDGVTRDCRSAIEWWKFPASHGYAPALALIGMAYVGGEGVEQDDKKARQYLYQSALQGYPNAIFGLGLMHYKKAPDQEEAVKALAWFYIARAKGHKDVVRLIENIEPNVAPQKIAEAVELSKQLLRDIEKKDPQN